MSYDGKLMRRAMVRFEEAKQRRADALHARERAVYAAVPRIAEIDAAPAVDQAARHGGGQGDILLLAQVQNIAGHSAPPFVRS